VPFTPIPRVALLGWEISTHGLMFLIAAAVVIGLCRAALTTRQFHGLLDSVPWLVLGSLVGARSLFIVSRPSLWSEYFSWIKFWEGGMVSHGGLWGCLLVLWLRRDALGGANFFDRICGPCLVGWGVGRIGCFLTWHGEEGVPGTVPWAVVVDGTARHPVTAYLAILYILGGVILMKTEYRIGQKTATALLYFALVRALSDLMREYDPEYLRNLSWAACSLTLGLGVYLLRRFSYSPGKG